jgi:transcriptional regulator with XRE-family HTH domain
MSIAAPSCSALVGDVATWQHYAVSPLEDLNDRAWFAYQCLPREKPTNRLGKKAGNLTGLPAYGRLEKDHELPGALFSKLFSGERKSVDSKTLTKLARALQVSAGWLLTGEGEAPTLTGPYEPRLDLYAQHDPARWAEQYTENPVTLSRDRKQYANPFEEAAETVRERVPARWLATQREEARGREWDRPAAGWALFLLDHAPQKPVPPAQPPAVVPQPHRKKAAS